MKTSLRLLHKQQIAKDKTDWTLTTKTMQKVYRMVYDKRIIRDDLTTIPYGYKY